MTFTKRKAAWVVIGMLFALVLVIVFSKIISTDDTITAIRQTQKISSQNVKSTKALAKRIEDCTTPGQPCYDRGQRQTAKAVGDINRVIVLASACAVGLDRTLSVDEREARIQRCVINRLSAEH